MSTSDGTQNSSLGVLLIPRSCCDSLVILLAIGSHQRGRVKIKLDIDPMAVTPHGSVGGRPNVTMCREDVCSQLLRRVVGVEMWIPPVHMWETGCVAHIRGTGGADYIWCA